MRKKVKHINSVRKGKTSITEVFRYISDYYKKHQQSVSSGMIQQKFGGTRDQAYDAIEYLHELGTIERTGIGMYRPTGCRLKEYKK